MGCGGAAGDKLPALKADLASGEPKKVAAALVGLKSLMQKEPQLAEARLLLGQHLLRLGNPAAAGIELQRALDLGLPSASVLPTLARALLSDSKAGQVVSRYKSEQLADPSAQADLMSTVAIAMAMQGDMAAATEQLGGVLRATPDASPAVLAHARLQGMQGKPIEALTTVEQLLKREPVNADAWLLKADLHSRQPGKTDAARQAYAEAIKLNPQGARAMLSLIALNLGAGDLAAAKKTFQVLHQLAPDLVSTGMAEANIAYASGDHARARELFQALLKAMPTNIALLLGAGENELRLSSAQQAEAHFAKAVALAPNHVLARRQLALAQLRLDQPARALVTLEPLLNATNVPVEALALAAEAHQLNGNQKAAGELFSRLAKLNPTDPKLRTAIALANVGRADENEVASELQTIAAADKGTGTDLALINVLVRRGQSDQALTALDALERKRPNDPASHQLRGQILTGQGKVPEARASFERALALHAGYFPAISALAALDVRENNLDSAKKRFNAVIKTQPGNGPALLGLAEVLKLEGAPPERVIAQIESAIQASPQDPLARTALIRYQFDRNNIDAALSAARAATVALPKNLDLLELQARCHLRLQQTSQAMSSYGKMAQVAPRSPRPYLGMVEVSLAVNDLATAERNIERALELSPGLAEARGQAIMLAVRRQQFGPAIDIARTMQKERPDEALGFVLEGEIEARRARWGAAATALQTAMGKQSPGTAPMKLYQALRMDKREADAERHAARWMEQHPQDIAFLLMLADAAQSAGQPEKAEDLYRRILKQQPDQIAALNNLSMLLAAHKKVEAVTLAERAVRAAPNQAVVHDTLAVAQASMGDISDAVESQRKAVALAPAESPFRLSLAKLLIQANKPALAKSELTKVIESASGQTELVEAKRLLAQLR
jgi:putative PEP-CTERM system TPR-repeat lipoprotein